MTEAVKAECDPHQIAKAILEKTSKVKALEAQILELKTQMKACGAGRHAVTNLGAVEVTARTLPRDTGKTRQVVDTKRALSLAPLWVRQMEKLGVISTQKIMSAGSEPMCRVHLEG